MSNIPVSLGLAAAVASAPINASATVAAGGTGGLSVFAGVVIADKGKPFELIRVTGRDWKTKLGKPLRPNLGEHAASLRCLEEALVGGDGYVVRVVPDDASYPVIRVKGIDGDTNKNNTSATSSVFAQKVTLENDDLMAFYITDGSTETRHIELTVNETDETVFDLTLHKTDPVAGDVVEKSWVVSMSEERNDDFGDSMFVQDVLARTNANVQCIVADDFTPSEMGEVEKTAFIGATSGTVSRISTTDYEKAYGVLSASLVGYTAMVGLGVTDPLVIEKMVAVANARRIDAFADIKASSYATAVTEMQKAAFNHERLSCYFFPYTAKDPHYSGRAHWGISGIAFAAKARGVAQVEGTTGGYHISPAGEERGIIPRKSALPFEGLDAPDYELLYKVRLNKIGLSSSGLLMIDDAITTRQKNDYLIYQHITSVMDAITRDFYALAKSLQHEPDGVTFDGLNDGMTTILDNYVASGALVPPRNPEDDGEEPYVLEVEQKSIDSWSVKWSCCVTGSARRIQGQPALIR